jgi:uncharacterized protein
MTLSQVAKNKYINVETFRKNGVGVKTPVWFVEDNGVLFSRTRLQSGKVKRLKNNSGIKIAPCKVNGDLLGDWLTAEAKILNDPGQEKKVKNLYLKKYGLQKLMFDLVGLFSKAEEVTLVIQAKQ